MAQDSVYTNPSPVETEDQGDALPEHTNPSTAERAAEIADESGESEFVKACRHGDLEQAKTLLQKAIKGNEFKSIYQDLIMASKLKKEKEKRLIIKAIVDEEGIENVRDSENNTLFRKLIKDKPDAAGLMLDECYSFSEKGELIAKFKFLEDEKRTGRKRRSHTCDKQCHVLELMYEQDKESESDLLLHPVVMSLLNWKWSTYMVIFFYLNLGLYLVFLSFLTAFALEVPNPQRSACTGNGTANSTASSCGFSSRRRIFLIFAALITIIFSVLRILLELCQIFNISNIMSILFKKTGYEKIRKEDKYKWFIKLDYFTSPTNYVEILLYMLSLVFVSVIHRECLCPSRGQWQLGTIAIFLAWLDLLLFMNKWPDLGIYIGMLWRIIKNFLKVSIIVLFLIIAFGLAFFMAFYEPDLPDTPFESPIVTFVTMISYVITSPDVSIFRLSNDDMRVDTIPYPVLSYFIWITFGIIMSVLFLNFLVGLAVDDVQELRKQANKERIKLLIQLFINVEETLDILRMILMYPLLYDSTRPSDMQTGRILPQSFYLRLGIVWGDDMRNIKSSAKKHQDEIEKKKEE